jgi:hypothetical protein
MSPARKGFDSHSTCSEENEGIGANSGAWLLGDWRKFAEPHDFEAIAGSYFGQPAHDLIQLTTQSGGYYWGESMEVRETLAVGQSRHRTTPRGTISHIRHYDQVSSDTPRRTKRL